MSNTTKVQDLARLGEWAAERTGKYQVTGLSGVDHALAARISAIFSNVESVADTPYGDRFASFLDRKPEFRVFTGKYDDVTATLRAIASGKAGQVSLLDPTLNPLALPVVNVSRSLGLSYENVDEGKAEWDSWAWRSADGEPMADMLIQHVEIAYDITLIAAEKETLSLMCNAMAASFYAMREHALFYKGYLFGHELDMQASLNSPKLMPFSDVSPNSTGKIFAASVTLNVTAEVRSAWELKASRVVTNTSLALRGQ